jgi:small GTP-binding protein
MQRVLTRQQQNILQREREQFATLENLAARLDAPAGELETLASARQQLDEFFLLVVVGEFNSGKSAFINALLGQRFLDEGVTPTTSQVHILTYGPQPAAEQVEPFLLRLCYPVEWLQEINIVDTPGTNAIILRHQEITEAFVPRSDLVLFVTSADRPFSESERTFLELVKNWDKKVVVVINKIDILENEAALNQVVDFVRNQSVTVLDTVPEIFPVSVKMAQQAKMGVLGKPMPELLQASRFPALEAYILNRLDQQERLRLKLASPLGVAERFQRTYRQRAEEQLALLQADIGALQTIDEQIAGYETDMRHDFSYRLTRIDNILFDLRARGDDFFEETIRISRFFDLLNASKLQMEFEQQVMADTPQRIEREVSELIDWMVERNFRQWQDVTAYLNQRAAQHDDRIVGEVGGRFEINRQELLQSVGRAAREVVATYDMDKAARELSESVKTSLAAMGAVEVGALGLGAILLHLLTRALDPLGVIAAGGVAIAGLFILPARRRKAKHDLDAKIEALRKKLHETIEAQFERELVRSTQEIREAIEPYTRFIRVERDKLLSVQEQLDEVSVALQDLRSQIHALT